MPLMVNKTHTWLLISPDTIILSDSMKFGPGFLNLCTVEIWGQIVLYCGGLSYAL